MSSKLAADILGLGIEVHKHLCSFTFVRWRRTNRNNRIAKKWRRFGAVIECRQHRAYRMGDKLLCCPHVFEKIKAATGATA